MAIAVSYQRAISTRNRHPNPGASPCNPWSFPQTKTREKKTLNPSQTERQRDRETERQREIKAQPITKDKSHLRLHNGRFNPDSIPIQSRFNSNRIETRRKTSRDGRRRIVNYLVEDLPPALIQFLDALHISRMRSGRDWIDWSISRATVP